MTTHLLGTLWAALFILAPAHAQQNVDCSKAFSLGCWSFNELIAARDAEIVNAISGEGKAARVCFVEGEDTFLVLSFPLPVETRWRKDADGVGHHNGPFVASLKRYKDGVEDDSYRVKLNWHRLGEDDDPTADGKGLFGRDSALSIDSNETNFSAKWPNKSNTTTTYTLSIRLATGRFRETYDWKNEKGLPTQIANTGHCFRYQAGKPE